MTFEYNVNKNTIEQDGKFVAYVNSVDGWRIANKLTVLAKENEQLKQSYKEFEDECQSTFNAMSRKQDDLYRKNFKLKEENEQLKYKINDLLYQIEYVGKNNKSCDGCECFLEDIGYCWMWDMNIKKEDIVVACDKRKVIRND